MNRDESMSEDSEYSEEDFGIRKKALPVDFDENFDPNKVPENGEEYLQFVMYEAKRCQDIVISPVKIKRSKPETFNVENEIQLPRAAGNLLPTRLWQEKTIEDFVRLRKFIFKQEPCKTRAVVDGKRLIDEDWPKLSTVMSLSQSHKIAMLEVISKCLSSLNAGESLSRKEGVWMYSLLATLEIPLWPDTCHCLRQLARQCSKIRSQLLENASEELFMPLNLCICIISRFFRQLDLADE